jgi:hypothetical protein
MRPALRFIGVWASLTVFTIVAGATLVPIDLGGGLEYFFIPPQWPALPIAVAAAGASLAAIVAIVDRLVHLRARDRLVDARTLRWLTPASMAGLVALGVAPAVRGVGERGAVLAYVFYDLRWWWAALAAGAVCWRMWRILRWRAEPSAFAETTADSPKLEARRRSGSANRDVLAILALFSLVVGWTIVTTPNLRWSGMLHGDEPKYLRYSDALAQGHGFDVSSRVPFGDQPANARPAWLGNLRQLARAIVVDVRALASDLRSFASDPSGFRWNRVGGVEGFFTGRHGGVYQIHPPGLSLLLVPGYTIDRYLLGGEPGYQNEFPSRLVMTTTTMVVLLGACAVALYRLLRRALDDVRLAWAWAAIGTLMLPLSAFGFQIYPEAPAALLILSVLNVIRLHPPSRARLAGAAAGAAALVWLHPRLMVVAAVLMALAMLRADRAGRRAVVAVAAAVFATFCAYNYHATGSGSPLAVFDVFASEVSVAVSGVPVNLLAYAFDRTWGVFAHTPLLLVAPAGLALMWRQDRTSAIGIAAIVLAAAVPAAAHSLSAAGGTPGRLVAAVMPLLIWPVAVFARQAWRSRSVAALVALLAVISLDNAISYNLDHVKSYGPLRDWSATGWKVHQMFPAIRGDVWDTSWLNFGVLIGLLAGVIGVAIWAMRDTHAGSDDRPRQVIVGARQRGSEDPRAGLIIAGFILVSTAATAAIGQWTRGDYLPRPGVALMAAADAIAPRDGCRGCLSSARASVQWRDLQPEVDRFRIETDADGETLVVRVAVETDSGRVALTRVRCDFGDGVESPWTAVLDRRDLQHRYARPGRYELVTWVEWGSGGHRIDRRTIEVPAVAGARPAF